MDLSWLPDDVDDRFIGYALITIMFMFMLLWLFSPASPITVFKARADYEHIVVQFEFIMYLVVPLALLGMVQSLTGHAHIGGRISGRVIGATERVKAKRTSIHERLRTFERQRGPAHEFHKTGEAIRERAPSKEFRKVHPHEMAEKLRARRKSRKT